MNLNNLDKKQKAYLAGFGALVGVLVWAFISAGVITHNFNRSQIQSDKQEALINGIILTETKNDMKYWEIYGETGKYDSRNEVAMLNNVVGNFYKDNKVTMSFESSKGTYDSVNKQITLFEDTFIVLENGLTLQTDKLTWTGTDKPVFAQGNVKITSGRELLALTDSVEISPNYEKIKLKGHSVSKIYKEKK
ncbi:MAG: LPS export ABC transporter periplasmic protein LptC [Heliobacteriaceae bacterium]|jgi:LPS export ABC transporter protein LptC|nr:LPS export ABC transporter periplasmic protein LptC [Heliobacteriaceae bacterium]